MLVVQSVFVIAVNVGTNPGLAAIWEDEQQRRREANESSRISAPPTQGQKAVDSCPPNIKLLSYLTSLVSCKDPLTT